MEKPSFDLWLEFEEWEPKPEDDPEDDFFIMHIRMNTGVTYALNVWTFKVFERIVEDNRRQNDGAGRRYLLPPDLFVERLSRPLLEEIVADLISQGLLRDEWIVKEPVDQAN